MSFLDIFTSTPAQPAAPAQPAQPATPPNQGNIPAAPTVATDPANPTVPAQAADPATPAEPNDPLAQFKDLWETKPNAEDPSQPAVLNPDDVSKAMANADFTKSLNPDALANIAAGGEEAVKALPELLNAVAKQVMVQSTMVNNKLTEKAVAAAVDAQQAKIPELVRAQTTSNHMVTENPIFNNPAIKPVMEATRSQLLTKFPEATPAEITKMTQDYIVNMGQAFAPQADPNALPAGETDWSIYLQ